MMPFDNRGRFVPIKCSVCGYGTLQHQGNGHFICDGLVDPPFPDGDLQPCTNSHVNGEGRASTVDTRMSAEFVGV